MKKFALFLAPLMAISFLTNCGSTKQYTVTFDSNGGTIVPSQTVEENKCATKPNDPVKVKEGYTCSFLHWESDNKEFDFNTPIVKNITLTAKWQESINQYTVNLTTSPSEGGTVTGGGPHAYNSSVTIKATPNDGYSFEGWYKDGTKVSLPNPHTFNMPANNVSYEARFVGNPYTLTVTSEDTSKGTVSDGGIYACGSKVTINATPKTGYSFEGWYKNGEKVPSASASYTFNMPPNDVSYEARFVNENTWYIKSDWWIYCSNGVTGEQATKEDIGREVNLSVNNRIHKVRLIDVDHDELNDGSGNKAHCTFEFSNLLSDENGYSLATLWNTKDGSDSTNHDYLNSDIRKALDGQGAGTLRWYQKGSPTKSTDSNYTKPVIDMLPIELKNNIKTVKKYIAKDTEYKVIDFNANIFVLTHDETTTDESSYAKPEGTTYQYYINHKDDSSHIKHQIMWHDGAAINPTDISDLKTWSAHNYAGNNLKASSYGGYYWLASPSTDRSNDAWNIGGGGGLYSNHVYGTAFAVAPAFCI